MSSRVLTLQASCLPRVLLEYSTILSALLYSYLSSSTTLRCVLYHIDMESMRSLLCESIEVYRYVVASSRL